MERQKSYSKRDILKNDRIFTSYRNFESGFDGVLAKYDEYVKQFLSHYAYHKLWLMAIRKSHKLQFKSTDGYFSYIVWPVGERETKNNSTTIHKGKSYGCHFQVAFQCPCPHEFAVNIVFNTYHYLDRWLNDKTYEELLQVSDNDSILVDDHEDHSQDNDHSSIQFESDGELFDYNNLTQHKNMLNIMI